MSNLFFRGRVDWDSLDELRDDNIMVGIGMTSNGVTSVFMGGSPFAITGLDGTPRRNHRAAQQWECGRLDLSWGQRDTYDELLH